MSVVNFSEEPVTLKHYDWLGTAAEVDEVFFDTDDDESGESQSDLQQNGSSDQGNVGRVHMVVPEEEALDDGQTGPSPSPESNKNGQKDLEELDDGPTGQGPSPESNMEHVESLGGKEQADDGASSQQMLGDGKTGPVPSPKPDIERDATRQILVPDSWITTAEELPQHVRKLYIDTLMHLDSGEQAHWLRKVLIEYADVFAKHDLDLGHFNELVYYIKTGQVHSIHLDSNKPSWRLWNLWRMPGLSYLATLGIPSSTNEEEGQFVEVLHWLQGVKHHDGKGRLPAKQDRRLYQQSWREGNVLHAGYELRLLAEPHCPWRPA